MIETLAAFTAWLGASIIVLSDGRRGLALGTALAAAALAVLAFGAAGLFAAGAIALGGGVASARRFGSGRPGWGIMPPGSTPRLVLCIAAALLAFWVAAGVGTGPGGQLRFAVMLVGGLAGARVFTSDESDALLTATSLLALAVGLAATFGRQPLEPWPFVAAAFVAGAVVWIPPRAPRAA